MSKEISAEMATIELAITVRVPQETLDRIDALVRARPTKIPRHSWLLEAIYEKLLKEECVKGDLQIQVESSDEASIPARYRLRFMRLDRGRERFLAPLTVVGNDSLERYLIEWGIAPQNIASWIQKAMADRTITIPDVVMPAERVGRFGFKVPGWGIQIQLRNGKHAILCPDPVPLPDKTYGDRLKIFNLGGAEERDAIIAGDGTVLSIFEEHIWPPGAPPGTINIVVGTTSTDEAEEIISAYKQFLV